MTKQVLRRAGKALVAGLIALAILCGFCFFYCTVPVRCPDPSGATEHVLESADPKSCDLPLGSWIHLPTEGDRT